MAIVNKRAVVLLLLCLTLLGVSATDIYITALPQMVDDFDTSPAIINSTMLFYNLGMAISVLFIGIFSNRFGRRPVLISSVTIFSITSLIIAFTNNIWLILGLRAIQGTGLGSIIILQRLILHDIMTEKEQIHAGGILVLGSIISPAVAPVIGAFITKYWGWHACFLISGILGLILTGISLIIIKETNSTLIKQLPQLGCLFRQYFKLLTDPICFNLVLITCFTFAALFAFLGVSSYLYILQLDLSPLTYSYIFILIAISYFVGNSYMMYLNKIGTSSTRIIKQGVLLGIIGVIIFSISLISNNHKLILFSITTGALITRFASALVISPVQIKIINHFKEHAALAIGIAICLQFTLAGITTTLVGLLNASSLLFGFIIITAGYLVAAALCFFILERHLRAK